jgi:DME family drug/metabolite transporter
MPEVGRAETPTSRPSLDAYGTYTVTSKRLLDAGHPPAAVMAAVFGGAAVLLAPLLFTAHAGWLATGDGLLLALYLGCVPTAAAYLLFARGLQRLDAGSVATFTLTEPVTAAILGVLVLSEGLEPLAAIGALLVLARLAAAWLGAVLSSCPRS